MRRILWGVLGSLVLLGLLWRPDVPRVNAQGVGIYSNSDCTTLTSPVTGQTVCFDTTLHVWKYWQGAAFNGVSIDSTATANGTAVRGISSGSGLAVVGIINAGSTGIAGDFVSDATGSPAVNGVSTGYYGGLFTNITNLGSDSLNAQAIGLVAQSGYANAGYFQQGQAVVPLATNNQYSALYVTRVGPLGSFNMTAPMILGEDATTTTGPLFVLKRKGASGATTVATVSIINNDGTFAFGTASVLNGSFGQLEGLTQNAGVIIFNNNGPSIGADGVSTPIWLGGRNAAGTISNVSVEALTNSGAATDMLFRSGSTGNKVGNGTRQMTLHGTGGLTIGSSPPTAQGTGTLNVASAVYTNNQSSLVASGSQANLTNIRGLSASSTKTNVLGGTCQFSASATCNVSFANNEPDANYRVVVGGIVNVSAKATSGFTLTATGTTSNAVDWMIFR